MDTNGVIKSPIFKVLVSDPIHERGVEILESVAQVTIKTKLSEEELCAIIGEYDALVVRSGTTVTAKVIEQATRMKIIGRAGVGVDNIDIEASTAHGIYVVCSPLGNTVAAAEHTLALMFALSRNITVADSSIRAGLWERSRFMGIQLQHKTLGIIGLGQVGSHVATVANTLGMKVLCYDPFVNEEKCKSLGCIHSSLEDVFRESDYITLHVPLIEATRYLIRKETIAKMKPTVRIVNASRGGVVNEMDICEALESNRIGGAALDVFEVERKFPPNSPLLKAPNLVLTPHLGASTIEAQINVSRDVSEQIKELFLGHIPTYAVNVPGISGLELKKLRPLLSCCEGLGRISAQLLHGPLEAITVTLSGSYANERSEPILLSATNGVLSYFSSQRVNFVNVRQKAHENKIHLQIVKEDSDASYVEVTISNRKDSASVVGSVMEGQQMLLRELQHVPIYMPVPPRTADKPVFMFYSKHLDIPGSLGKITTFLGDHQINIANCHLGRTEENGQMRGICVFCVDEKIDPSILNAIRKDSCILECVQYSV